MMLSICYCFGLYVSYINIYLTDNQEIILITLYTKDNINMYITLIINFQYL